MRLSTFTRARKTKEKEFESLKIQNKFKKKETKQTNGEGKEGTISNVNLVQLRETYTPFTLRLKHV